MSDAEEQARALARGAVEALPEGQLAVQLALGRPLRIKLGIDPTAPDIHLGHTVVLSKLRQFQDAGHVVILIVGDYTARVGDPSGRSAERPVLTGEQIDANAETFKEQAFKILDPERVEVRRNSEWLDMPSDRVFDLVRRFTLARLLERDDFQKRWAAGEPISALELMYPILQGYDSVEIEADVELGGTDQKFNLLFGRDVQGSFGRPQQSVMTMPILPGLDGVRRMSKSLGNYVAVTDEPADMFGKLLSIPDEATETYELLLLGEAGDPSAHPMERKRALARALVTRFHSEDEAGVAEERFDLVHRDHGVPDDVETVTIAPGEAHLPAVLEQLFELTRSEARRLLAQGGVKLDGEALGPALDLPAAELDGKVIQVGKRRYKRIFVSS